MKVNCFVVLILGFFSVSVYSSEHLIGVDYKSINYEPIGFKDKISAIAINYENNFSKYFSAEIYLGKGVETVSIYTELSEIEVEIEYLWGLDLKVQYPADDKFSMYAKIGYNEVRGKARALSNGSGSSDTISDPLYGVGSVYKINNRNQLYLEYTSYINDSNIKFDGFSIGYKYKI